MTNLAHSVVSIDTININVGSFGLLAVAIVIAMLLFNTAVRRWLAKAYRELMGAIGKSKKSVRAKR